MRLLYTPPAVYSSSVLECSISPPAWPIASFRSTYPYSRLFAVTPRASDTRYTSSGSPNQSSEGAGVDAVGPVCRLKDVQPSIASPYEDVLKQEDAAKVAYNDVYQAEVAANNAYLISFNKMAPFNLEATHLEYKVRSSKGRVEEAKASLLRLDGATQASRERVDEAHGIYCRARRRLQEAQAELHKAEAGVEIDGKRQRPTDSDEGIVAAKSAKVGAASAGKAARSRPAKGVSASVVVEPDAELEKRLKALRLVVDLEEKNVEAAKIKLAAAQADARKVTRRHRDLAASKTRLLKELEREAAEDNKALEDFMASPEFGTVYVAHCNASTNLEKAKKATAKAHKIKDEAERLAHPEAFPEEGWPVDDRENKRDPCDERDDSWYVNLVVPEYTPVAERERKEKEASKAKKPSAAPVRCSSRSSRGRPAEAYEA